MKSITDGALVESMSARLAQTPSFRSGRQRLNYRVFAVLVSYMAQHGTGSLRATTAKSVVELIDAQDARALVASEGYFSRTSRNPVDRVHHA